MKLQQLLMLWQGVSNKKGKFIFPDPSRKKIKKTLDKIKITCYNKHVR